MKSMQRNNYIISILLSLLLCSVAIYPIVSFRYNSASYSLMRLSHAIVDNEEDGLEQLCNVSVFTTSFDSILLYVACNDLIPLEREDILRLHAYSRHGAYRSYITEVFYLLAQIEGDLVFQKEFFKTHSRRVSQYYKIRGTDYTVVLMLFFTKNEGVFRLESVDNIILLRK